MHPSTPARKSRADSKNDLTGRHGDVDRNGDLVDELRRLIPAESPIDADAHARRIADVVTTARGRVRQVRCDWTVPS